MSDDATLLRQSIDLCSKWTVLPLVAGCVASVAAAPGEAGAFGAALFALTLAIAIIDWKLLLIPNWLNALVLVLGLAQAAALANDGLRWEAAAEALVRGATLGAVLLAVRAIYAKARGREGLGLGDVKLAGAGGLWVGWAMLPVIVEIATLSALAVFLIAPRLAGKPARWNARLPFGSFLAPAIWATWLIETWLSA